MGRVAGENQADHLSDGQPTGRRLIPRPRLTALLDSASTHVIALVAPAGYGKTTLAREWTSARSRESIWYSATEASSDVAALVSGLARSIEMRIAGVAARTIQRVRSAQRP